MIRIKNHPTLLVVAALVMLQLSGCGGRSERVVVQEDSPDAPAQRTGIPRGTPFIVHTNQSDRIVTIRHGSKLEAGFLVSADRAGKETGVLKLIEGSGGALLTAEILEGEPEIADIVRNASPARSANLAKIYRDPEEQID